MKMNFFYSIAHSFLSKSDIRAEVEVGKEEVEYKIAYLFASSTN